MTTTIRVERACPMAWRLLSGVALAAMALGTAPASAANPAPMIEERATSVRFGADARAGGTDFRCLGAGSRRVLGFKVYAVAFCLDGRGQGAVREYVRNTYPGQSGPALARALQNDQRFFDLLAAAPGDKLVVLKFLRNIPSEKIAGAFRDSLVHYMPEENARKVVAALSGNVRDGDVALLHSHGDDLVMELDKRARTVEDDPLVTAGLWRIWLGSRSPTPNLKASIAEGAVRWL